MVGAACAVLGAVCCGTYRLLHVFNILSALTSYTHWNRIGNPWFRRYRAFQRERERGKDIRLYKAESKTGTVNVPAQELIFNNCERKNCVSLLFFALSWW